MNKDEFIKRWDLIPKKYFNYNLMPVYGVEVVGEIRLLKYFSREELNDAENNRWLYNNHAEYDQAEPFYHLMTLKQEQFYEEQKNL